MIKYIFLQIALVILLLLPDNTQAQNRITLVENNGVLYFPCKVNGIQLDYIFDTGASVVTINDSIYRSMILKDLISSQDSIGKEKFQDASGNFQECVIFNIRKMEVGNMVLENIKGAVLSNNNSPLLFGQSALKHLGKYNLDIKNKMLEFGNDSLIMASIGKRSNSNDTIIKNILDKILDINEYGVGDIYYNKSKEQPVDLYNQLDSIINSDGYLSDLSKDTTNLIRAYSYLGVYYLNESKITKGNRYITKLMEDKKFINFLARGEQCRLIIDSSIYYPHGKKPEYLILTPGDSSYYYENKITKERFYVRSANSDDGHWWNHEAKFDFSLQALRGSLCEVVHQCFRTENNLECVQYGAKVLSFFKKYYHHRNTSDIGILEDVAQAKVNLGDYNGALHDIDTLFKYSKVYCKEYSVLYELTKSECEPFIFYCLKGICLFNLKRYTEAIAQFDKYFIKANAVLKKDETDKYDIHTSNSVAYYYRGLSKIELKNKLSGCEDLGKSGELGNAQAYEAIKDKCN
jgi:hypothetical protein